MAILHLKRQQLLHKNIYQLNYLLAGFYHPSWDSHIDYSVSNDKLVDLNNNWLKILSLPIKQFYALLDLTILSLFFTDQSLKLRGKMLTYLNGRFGSGLMDYASNNTNGWSNDLNIGVQYRIMVTEEFYCQSRKHLIERLYSDKQLGLKQRVVYKFDKGLEIDGQVVNFWRVISINLVENMILNIAKNRFCNYFW